MTYVNKKKSTTFHDAQFGELQSNTTYTNGGYSNGGQNVIQGETYTSSYPTQGETYVSSHPSEGKIVTKKVTVKDAEGNVIEQYEEPV